MATSPRQLRGILLEILELTEFFPESTLKALNDIGLLAQEALAQLPEEEDDPAPLV